MSAATPVIAAAARSCRWRVSPTAVATGGLLMMRWAVMLCFLLGAGWFLGSATTVRLMACTALAGGQNAAYTRAPHRSRVPGAMGFQILGLGAAPARSARHPPRNANQPARPPPAATPLGQDL